MKKKSSHNVTTKVSLMIVPLLAISILTGCDDNSAPLSQKTFTQIERLARPAINEGLVFNNALLIAFNQTAPANDLSAAAAPVVDEVIVTLSAFGNSNARINDIASAFLPDVMRFDTSISSPVGTSAYANEARPVGTLGVVSPSAGRKLEDDVIDITLTVLTNGAITTDNVPYRRPATGNPGDTNTCIGHKPLYRQTAPNDSATFPFLAEPN